MLVQLEEVVPTDDEGEPEPEAAAATQMFLANSLITVLVIDVRGFTPLSRELGEERISSLMRVRRHSV